MGSVCPDLFLPVLLFSALSLFCLFLAQGEIAFSCTTPTRHLGAEIVQGEYSESKGNVDPNRHNQAGLGLPGK